MSKKERIKEQISFAKFLLGILVAGVMGIVGWLFINITAITLWQVIIALLVLIPVSLVIVYLVMLSNKRLDKLERE